ncbi:DNA internalization-related competence Rec2 [Micractinium conductrix]|uniref:DNA internalization-related competence Rec2 n=1 Tax=Micractinium conductrix TaxID=554055 RepID=A0A2P6V7E9_9CHLO|nr:DNA internalization-related competence Rec2 [Micractinium conductrix]|eukprot:PSC70025.1 DNA internalization-related competence Rec2 [Micractinium conductrix]
MLATRGLPAPDELQLAALLSTSALAVGVNLLLVLLVPRGRKFVLEAVESVLAVALIVVLVATVLGLPLAIIYLVLKAFAFLLNLLLSIPAVGGLIESAKSAVRL